MIRAKFSFPSPGKAAFVLFGHSGFSEAGSDIVCAAASSAAFMAANTVTEILGVNADIKTSDGYMSLSFGGSTAASDIIKGLRLHLEELSAQYPEHVKVITEE